MVQKQGCMMRCKQYIRSTFFFCFKSESGDGRTEFNIHLYYMAQATSSEIVCSHWLRRVTCRSGLRVSSAILFTKEQNEWKL